MTILQVLYVLEVARQNSISKAAENLFVSQPALSAQIKRLEQDRIFYADMLRGMSEDLHSTKEEITNPVEYLELFADVARSMAKITASINAIDKIIQQKRKMMLDIEKESVMTIAASLRSIPKTEEKASNPLLEALRSG